MTQLRITDDLDVLLGVLPSEISEAVRRENQSDDLLEVILDFGRVPTARFIDHETVLSQSEITQQELDFVVDQIGDIDADNRAGLERTLHRISAIRNRRGHIVGLTCRVGRAVYGTIDILLDIIESGKSILILGRPAVGKTTLLREGARILAENRRVIIVDTSNEIGGDGDVPHPAVGKARRMQVREPMLQHEVMIEAVENHNPEVIIIDEIGRELEAAAARTIAERGVQLIGTAHGNTIDNLMLNPTLSDLIGGIEAVTLSDEEARRRGTQKTVLERRAPPTFDVLVEIQTRDRLAVHLDISESVDSMLRGFPLPPEVRSRDEKGKIHVQKAASKRIASEFRIDNGGGMTTRPLNLRAGSRIQNQRNGADKQSQDREDPSQNYPESRPIPLKPIHIYPFGVARNRLLQASKRLGVPAVISKDIGSAEVLLTLKSHYRKRQQTIMDAEHRGMPIYVLRSNTVSQMEKFLGGLFDLSEVGQPIVREDDIQVETQAAIAAVLNGERWVDLKPGSSVIRRLQHDMARQAELVSHSYGKEPRRRVRIYRE